MARVYNFSAGPSMLPEAVLKTAQAELLDYHGSGMSVMEMSHRSKWFDEIITNTEAAMRRVLNIPDNYKVGFFQGGATQQFAMVPLNFMTTGTADYLVTGNFSKKAAEEAAKFGTARIAASSKDKNFTYIPDVAAIDYDPNASYIHICQNNTIFGTKYVDVPQVDGIPLVADMSSMICSEPVDVSKYGVIYFGVQKNIAPAGMAVAIVRDDLLGKAAKGLTPDKIPTMMNYTTLLNADSMYNTPPCWCIYMTGLVMNYLENEIGGLENMQKRNAAKAKVLYDYLDGQDFYKNPVEKKYRSMMNVTFTSPRRRHRQGVLCRGHRGRLRQPEGSPSGGRYACVHLQRHACRGHRQAGRLYGKVPQGALSCCTVGVGCVRPAALWQPPVRGSLRKAEGRACPAPTAQNKGNRE